MSVELLRWLVTVVVLYAATTMLRSATVARRDDRSPLAVSAAPSAP